MKKLFYPILLLVLIVITVASASADWIRPPSIGEGVGYCAGGVCAGSLRVLGNFSVDGYYVNITVVNYNVTGTIFGDTFHGTFYGNNSQWNRSGTKTFLANQGDMVGIGTPTPLTALHIATNVGSGIKLERGTLDVRWWGGNNGPAYFGTVSNGALNIQTNNNNRITIASGATGGAVDVVGFLSARNLKVDGAVGDESVFNDDGYDTDFRIESNNSVNMFFVDGGQDRVGINTITPSETLSVDGTILFNETSTNRGIYLGNDGCIVIGNLSEIASC